MKQHSFESLVAGFFYIPFAILIFYLFFTQTDPNLRFLIATIFALYTFFFSLGIHYLEHKVLTFHTVLEYLLIVILCLLILKVVLFPL